MKKNVLTPKALKRDLFSRFGDIIETDNHKSFMIKPMESVHQKESQNTLAARVLAEHS